MKKLIAAVLAASSCLVMAAPAISQTRHFQVDIGAFDFTMSGIATCDMSGSVCYGTSFDGTGKDVAYGNTTDLPIAGFTFDFGTQDILWPGDQMDVSIWLDNHADGQFYHLVSALQFDFLTGQNDIPGYNLSDLDHVVRSATVSLVSTDPVPEAATWSMMVLGFGCAGAAMRRHRTSLRFSARVA